MNSQMENTAESEELPDDSTVQRAVQGSRLGRLGQWIAGAVRDSYLYRWLTAEPDPDVIVIDLRETWTVGPVIRLLDAAIDRLAPAVRESRVAGAVQTGATVTRQQPAVVAGLGLLVAGALVGVASVGAGTLGTTRLALTAVTLITGALATRERRSWTELRETRPVRLLLAALEPPEPQEEHTPGNDPSDDSDDK
ncbi:MULTISPECIES: hypothetical protein [unclassified Halorubrum]|uniref:hypothetical protein n=1 Tax=unclassified Halorubrum TaxID=2642239 RepID=UPI001F2BF9C6|nr:MULTISPECIES: hypothetical protein [unclassified Halorubrum]